MIYIEDITWPRRDKKFLFECWKILHSFVALTREIFFQHEKRNFVSPSGHVMFYLLYKHQWNTKPFHFNSFFGVKGAIYYVAIAKVIFSHVKITCYFHMWRYQVFARKLTWYFIGVYIIIRYIHWLLCQTIYSLAKSFTRGEGLMFFPNRQTGGKDKIRVSCGTPKTRSLVLFGLINR